MAERSKRTREQVVELVRRLMENTVERGCTPGEAAKFAAKVSEWVEEYQISEAELRAESGGPAGFDFEVVQNYLRTGKKKFDPGMTAVMQALCQGMCCRLILLPAGHTRGRDDASYGVVGEQLDADYVCQVATTVIPSLRITATFEGRQRGYERGGLTDWCVLYMSGAAKEIRQRLEQGRKERAEAKRADHLSSGTALVLVTGEDVAVVKRKTVDEVFSGLYPEVRTVSARKRGYNHEAFERGREAGKAVGLHVPLTEEEERTRVMVENQLEGARYGPDGRLHDPRHPTL